MLIDQRDIDQVDSYLEKGTQLTYRDISNLGRY